MFRSIIVPLDGSELAERALPYAVELASPRRGRLTLVRVALAPLPGGPDWEKEQRSAVEQAEAYLARIRDRIHTDVPVGTTVAYGDAAEEILQTVNRLDADAIVIATHGRSSPTNLLLGSVTERILAHTLVPVLVIHVRADEATPPRRR
jgi:nucleotide-binding universal stress UspA family protein